MKARFLSLAFAIIALAAATSAIAQSDYPNRNIRLLFGFSAGSDVGARMVAEGLAEKLHKPVTLENITGAAGNIAADQTAYASPDGYTIGLLTGANIILRPLLYRSTPYEPLKKLTPVSLAYRFPNVLVVGNGFKGANLAELVQLARTAPGTLTFGHLGVGSVTHLSGELLKIRADIDIRNVPYRGVPALLADIIAGRLDVAFIPPSAVMPLIRDGKLRALATTSRTRVPFAPDIPTVAESGYPDFEITAWFGVFVPVDTPASIINRLGNEVAATMASSDFQKKFFDIGLVPVGSTQSEFQETIARETALWTKLVKDAGIEPLD